MQVTLLEPRGQILSFADHEISGRLIKQLEKLGLRFILDDRMTTIKSPGDRVQVTLEKEVPVNLKLPLSRQAAKAMYKTWVWKMLVCKPATGE